MCKIKKIFSIILLMILGCNMPIDTKSHKIKLIVENEICKEYIFGNKEKLLSINEYNEKKIENVVYFNYHNNLFKDVSIEGKNKSLEKFLEKYYNDSEFSNKILKNKGINIGNSFIFSNEICDLVKIISNVEKFDNLNNKNIFSAKNLKLNINFSPSPLERFIPNNNIISYFEYTINKDGFLQNEIIKCKDGVLSINFKYDENKIIEILYLMTYSDGEILKFKKEYKYD